MKFLVDNQLPAALARWLVGRGHDALHVLDRDWAQSTDRQIWQEALAEERIVI